MQLDICVLHVLQNHAVNNSARWKKQDQEQILESYGTF